MSILNIGDDDSKTMNVEGRFPKRGELTELGPVADNIEVILCGYNKLEKIDTLPAGLKILRCQVNLLEELPDLPDTLVHLICAQNDLSSLPPLPPNLLTLECGQNELTEIGTLPPKLYTLECQFNHLTALPTIPPNLRNLICQHNQITKLENLPPKIYRLKCDENKIETITNFSRNSRYINVGSNFLEELPELPSHLKEFDCHNNDIRVLPALPESLIDINCGFNEFTSLPDLPSRLETLHCSNNELTSLPRLPASLESLVCNDNNIREYPNFPPSLNYLFLDCHKVDMDRLSPHNLAFLLDLVAKNERADFSEANNWGPHNFTRPFITALREHQESILFDRSAISVDLSTIPATTVVVRGDETVNDMIEGERPLLGYVADDPTDNIVFWYSGTFYPLNRSMLASALKRNSQNNTLVYFCDNAEEYIRRVDDKLYMRLRPFGIFLDFIGVDYIRYVVQDKGTYYKVVDTGVNAISAVSYNIFHYAQSVGIVSAAHCQEGQGGRVYALEPMNVEIEVPGTPRQDEVEVENMPPYDGPSVIPETPIEEQGSKRQRRSGGTRRKGRRSSKKRRTHGRGRGHAMA